MSVANVYGSIHSYCDVFSPPMRKSLLPPHLRELRGKIFFGIASTIPRAARGEENGKDGNVRRCDAGNAQGLAKEREAGIVALFRCSVTQAMRNAVAKTATELLKLL